MLLLLKFARQWKDNYKYYENEQIFEMRKFARQWKHKYYENEQILGLPFFFLAKIKPFTLKRVRFSGIG